MDIHSMNIIKFAFAHWNDEYDWWHPNNFPLDFVVDGKKQLPFCHTYAWFHFSVNTAMHRDNDSVEYFDCPAIKSDSLYNYKNVKYQILADIKENEKYIFPIMCNSWEYFARNKQHGFDFVPDRVISDVQQGKAKIVLINPLEGNVGPPDWEILDSWCCAKSFDKNQVYYIHGNLNTPTVDCNFTYIPVIAFYSYFKWNENTNIDYNPSTDKNLFLCYNRLTRRHRAITVCELIKNDLFERGLISYYGKHNPSVNLVTPELLNYATKLDSMVPVTIDIDVSTTNPATEHVIQTHYTETFLSLVTETLTEEEVAWRYPGQANSYYSPIFFSEKILKPIAAGHPFMVVGSRGILEALRKQGYRTFGKWWDESYDELDSTHERIVRINKVLLKLSNLDIAQLKNIRKEMQSVLDHNQKLFKYNRETVHKNNSQELVYQEVKKIWESF
jgi:hypothetical protein